MREDVKVSTIVHCLPHKRPFLKLKDGVNDMYNEDGTPNLVNYGTWDGRWRYDSEIMTSIIEVAEKSYEDAMLLAGHAWDAVLWEKLGFGVGEGVVGDDEIDDNEDFGVEVENLNPVVREPTIEISSGSEVEPEVNFEVSGVREHDEDMDEDSDQRRKSSMILKI